MAFAALAAGQSPGLATNGFDATGDKSGVPASAYAPGKAERDSAAYKAANPNQASRDYYERGSKAASHDDGCRAAIAYQAARYDGPVNGYENAPTEYKIGSATHSDGPRPKAGGGKFAAAMPATAKAIIDNVERFVQDITYPKYMPQNLKSDDFICSLILNNPAGPVMGGTLDFGKPYEKAGFACIETNLFFTSLVRELGFPAREANVLTYTKGGGKHQYGIQTAASQVFYGGAWHFYDPWESFHSLKDYLGAKEGHAGYGPGDALDAELFVRETAADVDFIGVEYGVDKTTDGKANPHQLPEGWKKVEEAHNNGATIQLKTVSLNLGVSGPGQLAHFGHDEPTIYLDTARPPTAAAFGHEGIRISYPDGVAVGKRTYRARVVNPTGRRRAYTLRLAGHAWTRGVSVTPRTIRGTVAAHARKTERFRVRIRARKRPGPPCVAGNYASPPLSIVTPEQGVTAVYSFETPIPNAAYYTSGGCDNAPQDFRVNMDVLSAEGGRLAWLYDYEPFPKADEPGSSPTPVHSGRYCVLVIDSADGHEERKTCTVHRPQLGFVLPTQPFVGPLSRDARDFKTYSVNVGIQGITDPGTPATISVAVSWQPGAGASARAASAPASSPSR